MDINRMEMKEKLAELDTQYRIRRMQEYRLSAALSMVEPRNLEILARQPNN